jgi:hypothetical protein
LRHRNAAPKPKIQTSCGFGVPLYDFAGERDQHFQWAENRGPEGLAAYRTANNLVSLDGLPTHWGIKGNDGQ